MKVIDFSPRRLCEHGHQIAAYCRPCERWRTLGLLDFVRIGKAEQTLRELSVRCGQCGQKRAIQIKPPHPKIDRYGPE